MHSFLESPIIKYFLILLCFQAVPASSTDVSFEHINLQPGVTHNMTRVILQDSRDFIWFGTIFGLVRYDGNEYKYYQNIIADSTSLSMSHITCLFEDHSKNLWIGTWGGGLNHFNPKSNQFTRFSHNPNVSTSLSDNNIQTISEDIYGNIWIGTQNGLNKIDQNYDESDISFQKYFLDLHNVNSISHNSIRALYADKTGNLYIGTDNGFNVYYQDKDIFERFFHFDSAATYRYDLKLIEHISTMLKERAPQSALLNITDFQNIADTFNVQKKGEYLIICSGEGYYNYAGELINKLYDTGLLESLNEKKVLWDMNFTSSMYAGGGQKNRLKIEVLSLQAGDYRLRYISDDSHSTAHWNHHPPDKTDWYGIQVLAITQKEKEYITKLLNRTYLEHPNSLSDHTISSIAPGFNSDYLWIGTNYGGLNRFNLKTKRFTHYTNRTADKNSIASNNVTSIIPGKHRKFWIGTTNGLSHFNPATNTFNNYYHSKSDPQSLSSNEVLSLLKDRTGILWVGTNMGSIEKLNNYEQNFEHLRIAGISGNSINTNNILSLYPIDTSTVWIGTNASGLFRYDLNTKKTVHYIVDKKARNILDANIVHSIIPANKRELWIGTLGGGLIRLDINTGASQRFTYSKNDYQSISSNNIQTLLLDSKQRLWIGTDGYGLNLLKKDSTLFQRFYHKPKGLKSIGSNTIYSIHEDYRSRIWFGTCNGMALFNEKKQAFKHFPLAGQSGSTCIYDIISLQNGSNNFFWLGTSDGLVKFNPAIGRYINVKGSTDLNGESILGIEEGLNGNLWLSTNKGLVKFHPDSGVVKWFETEDGLQSNIFNINAHTRLPDKRMVFGGINGLNIIDPFKEEQNRHKPQVHITGFKVFSEERNLQYDSEEKANIELSYKDNFFTIDFASLDYKKPSKNKYMYRLIGINKNWVRLKKGHSASYTNIEPGNYAFEVKGSNSNGVWNEKKTVLLVSIIPPFWQTSWFRIGGIFLFLGMVGGLIYYIRHKEKRRTELNKKISELKLQSLRSRMNPHFIFNTINAIQYFISENASKEAYFYLSKFSKLLRSTLNSSEMSVIPLSKELEILDLYFALQKLRYEDKLEYTINVPSDINTGKTGIPSMLIQPYIENAIEHGIPFSKQSGMISVLITRQNNSLICTVEDDGIGIKQSLKDKDETSSDYPSKGMQLTRERLRIINESISQKIDVEIADLSDLNPQAHGTRVTIHIPYKPL